jgi:hypothetical protein
MTVPHVAGGKRVKKADLGRVDRIGQIEQAQTAGVVRLVERCAAHVEVVVGGGQPGGSRAHQHGIVRLIDVEDQGTRRRRRAVDFIEFVVDVQVAQIFAGPGLMGELLAGIRTPRHQEHVRLVRYVHHVHAGAAVRTIRNLSAGQRTGRVGNDGGVVRAGAVPGPGEGGVGRVAQVVGGQSEVNVRVACVKEAAFGVQGDVVRGAQAGFSNVAYERDVPVVNILETDDLDAAADLVGHHVAELAEDLDVRPGAGAVVHAADDHGVVRIADLHDGHAALQTHQRVLAPGGRGVSPAVVAGGVTAREVGQREVTEQIDVLCRELSPGQGRPQNEQSKQNPPTAARDRLSAVAFDRRGECAHKPAPSVRTSLVPFVLAECPCGPAAF